MSKPYRLSPGRRLVNALVRPLARLGLAGPRTHLLTVPGRATGTLYSTPVSLVTDGDRRWLVAPYGERNWVKNARAAGWVELRRGGRSERVTVTELQPTDAVPVLRRYYRLGRVTRPFFDVDLTSSDALWLAEAPRHPTFRLDVPVASPMTGIVLVAATAAELRGHEGLVCGVGPVEAAVSVAIALERHRPLAVLHIGIAGAQRGGGPELGSLVVGDRAVYEDRTGDGLAPREVGGDPRLVAAVAAAVAVTPITIGTTARVGGSGECVVEAMEGFAVLRACELAGVPAVEVRAISNYVDDARSDWRIDDALAALGEAIPSLLQAVETALSTGG